MGSKTKQNMLCARLDDPGFIMMNTAQLNFFATSCKPIDTQVPNN